jgi:hypothetical protein
MSTGTDEASGRPWVRALLTVMCLGFAAFWIWALFFASKESVNRIGDAQWAERAQSICTAAHEERIALQDLRRVDDDDPALLSEKAGIVDQATTILDGMIDDLEAVPPTDSKGADIVPLWIDDYRTYLQDRRNYTERLRGGDNVAFTETADDGIPISEKLQRFAVDNDMKACVPPTDLSA